MGEALTFKFWIVILVTSKLHSRWRFYNGLCVAAQKYVDFTAVSGSELLAGNNNFTVFTISNENTEKRHIFILKNNSHALFSYLDKKSIYFLDEWKNLASRYVSWRQFEILCHNLDLLKCTYRSMDSQPMFRGNMIVMFTKFHLPRFDRSKKDVTIYTIIYIYCCYVIKYIDVTILKKIYIIEKSKK